MVAQLEIVLFYILERVNSTVNNDCAMMYNSCCIMATQKKNTNDYNMDDEKIIYLYFKFGL